MKFFDNYEEYEQNRASILLEEYLKPKPQDTDHHSHLKGDMVDDLTTVLGDFFENLIKDIIKAIKERQERSEREEMAKALEREAEKFLTEAKTVGELEKRLAIVEKVYKNLDNHHKFSKEDRTNERLDINRKLEIMDKFKERCSEISLKDEPINFYSRTEFFNEIKRVKTMEGSINIDLTNSELLTKITNSSNDINRQLEQSSKVMKDLYEKAPAHDWEEHKQRDMAKYLYPNPPHEFKSKGILKDSDTGRAITDQAKNKSELGDELAKNTETIKILKTIDPNHQHQITYQSGDDLHKIIREHAQAAPKSLDLSKEQNLSQSR